MQEKSLITIYLCEYRFYIIDLPIIGVSTCLLPDNISWLAVTVLATVTNWFDKTADLTWFDCTWRVIWLNRGLWDPISWIACPP